MTSTEATPETVKTKSPKKKAAKAGAGAKPKAKPNHPPTSEMVDDAISTLKERGGSSLHAIKKFVSANYEVDAEKLAPFIKKYLKGAVASGKLVQTKGTGAAGSFKLAGAKESERKRAAQPRKPAAKKEGAARTPKSPSKAKKAKKPPTSPKAPKAKRAAKSPAKPKKPAAKKPAKKAAPKKK